MSRKSELNIIAPVLPVGDAIPGPDQYAPFFPSPVEDQFQIAFLLESIVDELIPSVVHPPIPFENVEFGSLGPPQSVV